MGSHLMEENDLWLWESSHGCFSWTMRSGEYQRGWVGALIIWGETRRVHLKKCYDGEIARTGITSGWERR